MRLDRDGNIWATDVGAHVVYKLNPQGQVLLTLGTKGEAGEWNEATGSRKLNQPNDIAHCAQTATCSSSRDIRPGRKATRGC